MAVAAAVLAAVAGADRSVSLLLAAGMFGFQVSIGALNDLLDAERDRLAQPDKPIPAGAISRRTVAAIAVIGGAVGLLVSASFGWAVLAAGAVGAGCGYAYDLVARRAGLAWLTFAIALPSLLAWVWLAAAGTLPPHAELLLPLAALAGPAVHLANSMADADTDRESGTISLAIRLGRQRSGRVLLGLDLAVWALAWLGLALLGPLSTGVLVATSLATAMAVSGALFSIAPRTAASDLGWTLAAAALAMLAVIWVATLAGS